MVMQADPASLEAKSSLIVMSVPDKKKGQMNGLFSVC
jgi:hypothetical protein